MGARAACTPGACAGACPSPAHSIAPSNRVDEEWAKLPAWVLSRKHLTRRSSTAIRQHVPRVEREGGCVQRNGTQSEDDRLSARRRLLTVPDTPLPFQRTCVQGASVGHASESATACNERGRGRRRATGLDASD